MQQQETIIEQPLNQAPSDAASAHQSSIAVIGIVSAYLGFTVLVIALLRSNLSKAILNRIFTIKHNHQIPCGKCQYFKNNRYLQCAIHPTKVLSQEAINCPDYLPQDKKLPRQ
ncbi:MAG: hypothetical protein HXY43_02315 [Fischerella sp.]|jgi:hypothetical protein|uniref:hypothetical protein n=1 Tax=Fischerella sp. TaxID=1191 RepID=UPI00183EF640|nr:hypothetical protein [Fischerella sp.]NWF58170.1 hypothetical protein [Fischerella sp.]